MADQVQTQDWNMPDGGVVKGVPLGTSKEAVMAKYKGQSVPASSPTIGQKQDDSFFGRLNSDFDASRKRVAQDQAALEKGQISPASAKERAIGETLSRTGGATGEVVSSAAQTGWDAIKSVFPNYSKSAEDDVKDIGAALKDNGFVNAIKAAGIVGTGEWDKLRAKHPEAVGDIEAAVRGAPAIPIIAKPMTAAWDAEQALTSPFRAMKAAKVGAKETEAVKTGLEGITKGAKDVSDIDSTGEALINKVAQSKRIFEAKNQKAYEPIWKNLDLKAPVTTTKASQIAKDFLDKMGGDPAALKELDPAEVKWLEQFAPKELEKIQKTTSTGKTNFNKDINDVTDLETSKAKAPSQSGGKRTIEQRQMGQKGTESGSHQSTKTSRTSTDTKIVGYKPVTKPLGWIKDSTKKSLWDDAIKSKSTLLKEIYHGLKEDVHAEVGRQSPQKLIDLKKADADFHRETKRFEALDGIYDKGNKAHVTAAQALDTVRKQILSHTPVSLKSLTALKSTLPKTVWNDMRDDILRKMAHDAQGQFSVRQFIDKGSKMSQQTKTLLFDGDKLKQDTYDKLIKMAQKIPKVGEPKEGNNAIKLGMKWFAPSLINKVYGIVSQMDMGKQMNVPFFKHAVILEAVKAGASQEMASHFADQVAP